MELMMKSMADMVTSMGVTHVKCSKSDSVIYKLMFCHTEGCPTDFTDLHGFIFLGLTKTDINLFKFLKAIKDQPKDGLLALSYRDFISYTL